MRVSLTLTFWLCVMDAMHWAYRRAGRGAAYGHTWSLALWLAVMDCAYRLYVWALRKASNATDWR